MAHKVVPVLLVAFKLDPPERGFAFRPPSSPPSSPSSSPTLPSQPLLGNVTARNRECIALHLLLPRGVKTPLRLSTEFHTIAGLQRGAVCLGGDATC